MTATGNTATKPNGLAAAAFLAAGVGAFVLGLNTTLASAFPPAEGATAWWDFSANYGLGAGVGPLSGKVIVAVIVYVATFAGFGVAWSRREVNLTRVVWIAAVLLLLGLAGTFPPVFEAFHPD
jgi:hypothetical protein